MEVDVVVVAAAEGEDEAVLAVADGRLGDWEPFDPWAWKAARAC